MAGWRWPSFKRAERRPVPPMFTITGARRRQHPVLPTPDAGPDRSWALSARGLAVVGRLRGREEACPGVVRGAAARRPPARPSCGLETGPARVNGQVVVPAGGQVKVPAP